MHMCVSKTGFHDFKFTKNIKCFQTMIIFNKLKSECNEFCKGKKLNHILKIPGLRLLF